MTKQESLSIFTVAGIPVSHQWELMNQYWPRHANYHSIILDSPWWLMETPMGLIRIGWRKRVIDINWEHTRFECIVTEDDVTKSKTNVHAWDTIKAAEYLRKLYTDYTRRKNELRDQA